MKAIKVEVSESEWSKVGPFVNNVNATNGEDAMAYRLSRISFLVITSGACSMRQVRIQLMSEFKQDTEVTEIK